MTHAAFNAHSDALILSLIEDGLDNYHLDRARMCIDALWGFHWGQANSEARGTVRLDVSSGQLVLVLETWVADSESDDPTLKPIKVQALVDWRPPMTQIRELIHHHLCHEADELMWFDYNRPFHPHRGEQ